MRGEGTGRDVSPWAYSGREPPNWRPSYLTGWELLRVKQDSAGQLHKVLERETGVALSYVYGSFGSFPTRKSRDRLQMLKLVFASRKWMPNLPSAFSGQFSAGWTNSSCSPLSVHAPRTPSSDAPLNLEPGLGKLTAAAGYFFSLLLKNSSTLSFCYFYTSVRKCFFSYQKASFSTSIWCIWAEYIFFGVGSVGFLLRELINEKCKKSF